jgi:hypothetical protein
MEMAGASAVRASALLTGGGGKDGSVSAYELTGMAAVALERCNVQLENVAALVQDLGAKLDGIRIPSLTPKYTDVMGLRVMTGVDMSELPLVADAAQHLRSGADRLSDISDDFTDVAQRLSTLGTSLTRTGQNLSKVGEQLQDSGTTLRKVSDKAPSRTTRAIALPAESAIPEAKRIESEIQRLKAESGQVRARRVGAPTSAPVTAKGAKQSPARTPATPKPGGRSAKKPSK